MARTTDTSHPRPRPRPPSPSSSPPDADADLARLQSHLGLPATGRFPTTPLAFLHLYLDLIPASLTHVLARVTTPRERSRIRGIKSRRMIWAGLVGVRTTRPRELGAEEGWRRWPLLWERSGGDPRGPGAGAAEDGEEEYASRPVEMARGIRVRDRDREGGSATRGRKTEGLFGAMDDDDDDHNGGDHQHMSSMPLTGPPPRATTPPTAAAPPPPPTQSARLSEESSWPSTSFMPSAPRSLALQVNRLGSLMRDLEEERQAQGVVAARQRERRELTDAGERGWQGLPSNANGEPTDEHEVVETFERALLELFLDGKDTLPYEIIDFADPVGGNPLLEQDTADAYFDDEDEVDLSTGGDKGKEGQLAEGEYDY